MVICNEIPLCLQLGLQVNLLVSMRINWLGNHSFEANDVAGGVLVWPWYWRGITKANSNIITCANNFTEMNIYHIY